MSQPSQRNPLLGLVAAGIALYLAQANGLVDLGKYVPALGKSTPAVVVAEPSAELKAAVAPITAKFKEKPADAPVYANIYTAVANLIEAEPEKIKTTADVRAVVIEAGDWATRNKIGSADTAKVIDGVVVAQLGANPVPLTPETRAKAIALYRAIAWAAQEAK